MEIPAVTWLGLNFQFSTVCTLFQNFWHRFRKFLMLIIYICPQVYSGNALPCALLRNGVGFCSRQCSIKKVLLLENANAYTEQKENLYLGNVFYREGRWWSKKTSHLMFLGRNKLWGNSLGGRSFLTWLCGWRSCSWQLCRQIVPSEILELLFHSLL